MRWVHRIESYESLFRVHLIFIFFYLFLKKSTAQMIKNTMDKKFGSTWHCIIGEGFGFDVTCQRKYLLHIYYGCTGVLCYKSWVQLWDAVLDKVMIRFYGVIIAIEARMNIFSLRIMCNHIMRKWVTVIDGYYRHGHVFAWWSLAIFVEECKESSTHQTHGSCLLLHDP